MNRRSKLPRKRLEQKLDALWSALVKLRDGGKCQHCGKTFGLEAHHVIERRYTATRWDLENGVTLCYHCHDLAHEGWFIFELRPILAARANQYTARTTDYMQQALIGLQLSAKAMEGKR